MIRDGDVLRVDWEERPRFYLIRLYPFLAGRVTVHVTLEGDPTAWSLKTADDNAISIEEVVHEATADIEDLCWEQWEREANDELDDMRRSEERYYYR